MSMIANNLRNSNADDEGDPEEEKEKYRIEQQKRRLTGDREKKEKLGNKKVKQLPPHTEEKVISSIIATRSGEGRGDSSSSSIHVGNGKTDNHAIDNEKDDKYNFGLLEVDEEEEKKKVLNNNNNNNTVSKKTWHNDAYTTAKSLLAGGIAGMTAKTVVAPFDRAKILLQVSHEAFSLKKVTTVLRNIVEKEGPQGLWRGHSATILRVFPYAGIQFMTFDAIKHQILLFENSSRSAPNHLTAIESLFGGSMAGFISCCVTYPLDFARANLAVISYKQHPETNPSPNLTNNNNHHNLVSINKGSAEKNQIKTDQIRLRDIFSRVYQEFGFQGFYRGLTPTLLGILPYAGIAFCINEKCNQYIRENNRSPTTIEKLACGAFSGLIAQSATYPLDVVRRRMQTASPGKEQFYVNQHHSNIYPVEESNNKSNSRGNVPKSTHLDPRKISMVSTFLNLHGREGIRGLFKGLSMNWIKGPISLGISFTTFDYMKRLLNIKAHRKGD